MHILNNLIEKNWISLELNTYKIECKEKFLKADGEHWILIQIHYQQIWHDKTLKIDHVLYL